MADAGIKAFHGRARFIGKTTLQVGKDLLESRYIVIAAGAKPVDLQIDGAELLATSDDFLELDALPRRVVFVGGGYIAFEFSHVAVRAGAQVSMMHRSAKPLVRFDPDLVDMLTEATRELGVDIHLRAEVTAITKGSGCLRVHASSPSGEQILEADLVVHAAGRVPDIDDLDLAAAGVERDRMGVKVNDYLQSTSNPAVYAAGDAAASGPPLTPLAGYGGRIVAQNLLKENHVKPNYGGVPSVVFSIPPLASTGLREDEARDRGLHFQRNLQDTSSWYSSRRIRESCSGFKVLVENGTGKILGAHLLGPEAGETINLFALAIRQGLTASDLKDMLYSYPTHASDIRYML
jgi:glutathione reductase (NADPH)